MQSRLLFTFIKSQTVKYLGFALFTQLSLALTAQHQYGIGAYGEFNNLLLHSKDIAPIGTSNPVGAGVDFYALLLRDSDWSACHCIPAFGVSLNWHSFDNPSVLGWGMPLYGYLEPRFYLGKGWTFSFRGGAGIAWLSTPFDSLSNPLNLSYSRHLNTFVMVNAGLRKDLSPQWSMHLVIQYNHTSNGGVQVPNKGLNYYGVRMGVDYTFSQLQRQVRPKVPRTQLSLRRSWELWGFAAGKRGINTEANYLIAGLIGQYSHQVGRISAINGGIESVYHGANASQSRFAEHSPLQINLLVGHSFLLGRFVFVQQAGVYLYRGINNTPDWYQRYSLQYQIAKKMWVGTGLKAHGHVAEWLEARIGYSF